MGNCAPASKLVNEEDVDPTGVNEPTFGTFVFNVSEDDARVRKQKFFSFKNAKKLINIG